MAAAILPPERKISHTDAEFDIEMKKIVLPPVPVEKSAGADPLLFALGVAMCEFLARMMFVQQNIPPELAFTLILPMLGFNHCVKLGLSITRELEQGLEPTYNNGKILLAALRYLFKINKPAQRLALLGRLHKTIQERLWTRKAILGKMLGLSTRQENHFKNAASIDNFFTLLEEASRHRFEKKATISRTTLKGGLWYSETFDVYVPKDSSIYYKIKRYDSEMWDSTKEGFLQCSLRREILRDLGLMHVDGTMTDTRQTLRVAAAAKPVDMRRVDYDTHQPFYNTYDDRWWMGGFPRFTLGDAVAAAVSASTSSGSDDD